MARISRPLHTRFGIVRAKTQFGGAVWVPVVHRRGAEASLLVPLGPAGRIVQTSLRPLALRWSSTRVVVDLGSARLTVYQAGRRPAAFPIGEGASSSPTPVGRFFVTDRLPFPVGSPYAPFALGLSAHQTHLAPAWIGGDQIAIHPGPMGAVSNGCIHVGFAAISLLRQSAALGTLVTVQH